MTLGQLGFFGFSVKGCRGKEAGSFLGCPETAPETQQVFTVDFSSRSQRQQLAAPQGRYPSWSNSTASQTTSTGGTCILGLPDREKDSENVHWFLNTSD